MIVITVERVVWSRLQPGWQWTRCRWSCHPVTQESRDGRTGSSWQVADLHTCRTQTRQTQATSTRLKPWSQRRTGLNLTQLNSTGSWVELSFKEWSHRVGRCDHSSNSTQLKSSSFLPVASVRTNSEFLQPVELSWVWSDHAKNYNQPVWWLCNGYLVMSAFRCCLHDNIQFLSYFLDSLPLCILNSLLLYYLLSISYKNGLSHHNSHYNSHSGRSNIWMFYHPCQTIL